MIDTDAPSSRISSGTDAFSLEPTLDLKRPFPWPVVRATDLPVVASKHAGVVTIWSCEDLESAQREAIHERKTLGILRDAYTRNEVLELQDGSRWRLDSLEGPWRLL